MAYTKLKLDRYDESKKRVARLKTFNDPMLFSTTVSLSILEDAVDNIKTAADEKNRILELADKATEDYNNACEKEEKILKSIRNYLAAEGRNDTDIFVAAGGARQSDVVAQQQQTRSENRRAAEEKALQDKAKSAES